MRPIGLRRGIGARQRPIGGWPRGQSLVEFALVLPVLMLVLLIAIDFGRVFLGWVQLNNAARIGANYAAAAQPPLTPAQQTQYRTLLAKETAGINCDLPNPVPDPTYPNGTAVGGQAVVSLTCAFHPLTPFISAILGSNVTVGAGANFPIRAGVVANLGSSGGGTFVAPNQDFSLSPSTGDWPLIVNVTLGTQNGGAAQTWNWSFGDGATSNSPSPGQHTYTAAGVYTVTLQESNPGGTSPTYSHTVTVTSPLVAPVASFYGLVPAPCVDSGAPLAETCGGSSGSTIYYRYNPNPTISFYDTSQNASGATYAWNFGDPTSGSSNTSTDPAPSHTYTLPGTYTVALTVTTAGGTNTATRTAYIHLGCIVPNFVQPGTNSSAAAGVWTGANFLSTNLSYWSPNGNGNGGTYSTTVPSTSYTIGQQNPQAAAFFDATQQGATYACTTAGRVAPARANPAP